MIIIRPVFQFFLKKLTIHLFRRILFRLMNCGGISFFDTVEIGINQAKIKQAISMGN